MNSSAAADAQHTLTDRILDAAGEVFAAQGLHATLADVARTAGVGVATVYRRFANKDELILALFDVRFRHTHDQLRRVMEAEDPWQGFVAFFEGGVRQFARDRGFREFVISGNTEKFGWARGAGHSRMEEAVHEQQRLVQEGLDDMLRRCQEAGAIRDDVVPHDLFVLTMAAVSSIEVGEAKGEPEAYRRVIGIVLDGLRPSREAPTPLPPHRP
ncbi:TetR/AcrR family transcriptional regulator [Kineosporia sp. J2-2]|uniref:TetR/AcrR family transcriptional regulator n=1 Tax=Kineosporia corallincola TaxID=2835133 RepID=A0ABS5TEX2_9ACTN|nr:TetR/AcrR family transcriptional regulator [Kineosporia corallincola]MBT0769611.1 TetR/AcrR family transcriptional regulator [Kineosporia corallincola]